MTDIKFACIATATIFISSCATIRAQDKYVLTYLNQDTTLDVSVEEGIQKIFVRVYPQLVNDFNTDAQRQVTINIDTTYTGVAYASNGQITISSAWLHKKPEDLDLVTHELMHLVQSYPNNAGPGWLTEGIADYVRYKYGVDNKRADWSLTPFNNSQNYKNSYRITARFLVWASQKYDQKLVYKLDNSLRQKKYNESLWKTYTKKDLDTLWIEYSQNPKLEL